MAPRAPVPHVCRPKPTRSLLGRVAVALLAPFVGPVVVLAVAAAWLATRVALPFTIPDESEAGTSIQAGLFQTDIDALVAGIARTGVISGCDVTAQGTPNLTVAVAAGVVESLGVPRVVTADAALVVASADVTNPRFDLVIANSAGTPAVVAGTAAAAPLPPNPTAGSVLLATIYVPALDATIGAAQITDKRVLLAARAGVAFFGDGSDGTVTITGTTTLTRPMFYDVLTVQSGGVLAAAAYQVFVKTRCQVDSGGKIHCNGSNGSAAGAGANGGGASGGPLVGVQGAGGAGGTGVGTAGTSQTARGYGGAGGNGGTGTSGGGGSGGAITGPTGAQGSIRGGPPALAGFHIMSALTPAAANPGGGGGGGGGDGTAGGGGGGAGGTIWLAARHLILNGTIECVGGTGGTPAAGNRGGGGGGGGGLIMAVYNTKTGSGSFLVTGGAKGLKSGTGTDGTDGTVGLVIELANV